MFGPVLMSMGAVDVHDFAEEDPSFQKRITRCYELAAKAFYPGHRTTTWKPTALVHGTWHGPEAPDRIPHAWVLIGADYVWEPITMAVCIADMFAAYTHCEQVALYNGIEARRNLLRHQTFGPWHDIKATEEEVEW